MTFPAPDARESKPQLRKTMGFWDVMLFNIAAGPRSTMDRRRRPQWHFIHQPVGAGSAPVLRTRRAGHQ